MESRCDGLAGGRARNRRRTAGGEGRNLIVVEGTGRAFARKFGVCGKASDKHLPDFELSWLRILQHELATHEADAIEARRVSRRLRLKA
jgi:hypothetical protein